MKTGPIKLLIWLYLILLIFEGSLRKWVFPEAADLLLIVRDPVVLLIYVLALVQQRFPVNGFIVTIAILAVISVFFSLATGQHNLVVMLYGLRINYVHLPLIWVMGAVMNVKDVRWIGSFLLLIAIPMTIVMVLQFQSPMDAVINRGVGGDEFGQIFGADGRIRPPGFFSFITGPQLFLPLAAAFFCHQAGGRRHLPWILLVAAGMAIAIALPVSISRTAMLATALVGAVAAFTLLFSANRGGAILKTGLVAVVVLYGLSFLPVFSEGREVFLSRWETAAAGSGGDAWENVSNRVFGGLFQPFYMMTRASFFGEGIGVGSNVGARLISGSVGFLLAEDEWSKVILELGPLLGAAFLIFRLVLTVHLGWHALQALLQTRESLPLLLFAATGLAVLQFQWGPPTVLGFTVFGSGLILASLRPEPAPATAPAAAPVTVERIQPRLPPATVHRPPVAWKQPVT